MVLDNRTDSEMNARAGRGRGGGGERCMRRWEVFGMTMKFLVK